MYAAAAPRPPRKSRSALPCGFSALLARVSQRRHVDNRANLKSRRVEDHGRVLGPQSNRLVQVLRFNNPDTAQLLLRLDKGAVGNGHLAVLESNANGCARILYGFPTQPVPLGPHLVVISETRIEKRILLAFRHLFPFLFILIPKAYIFHDSLRIRHLSRLLPSRHDRRGKPVKSTAAFNKTSFHFGKLPFEESRCCSWVVSAKAFSKEALASSICQDGQASLCAGVHHAQSELCDLQIHALVCRF